MPAWQVSLSVQAFSPSEQGVSLALLGLEQTPVEVLQVPALWHWSGAGQTTGLPPVQAPSLQVSVCVQALLSLQGATLLGLVHLPPEQTSSVQRLPSLQSAAWVAVVQVLQPGTTVPAQVPPPQTSLVVQALLSLHDAVLLGLAHLPSTQVSSVQRLPSPQSEATKHDLQPPTVVPPQTPPEHLSLVVQALLSSQVALLFGLVHLPLEQMLSVQALLSAQSVVWVAGVQVLQPGTMVPAQEPVVHLSLLVQALLSLHPEPLAFRG
jgi:hypothetical protein